LEQESRRKFRKGEDELSVTSFNFQDKYKQEKERRLAAEQKAEILKKELTD
jgi:hypothetical protein